MSDPSQFPVHRQVGRPRRPAHEQVVKNHAYSPNMPFQPLPAPTVAAPYRLELAGVVAPKVIAGIESSGKLVCHVMGDVGGVKAPQDQHIVAQIMERDFGAAADPAFCYLLGDVIYYNGERSEYYPQFYEPYVQYPAPILAVPGNHDGAPLDPTVEPSLAGFVANFCAPRPQLTPEARDTNRAAMTQPFVYWTLRAPFLTMVGLYSNVPEGGHLEDTQLAWLASELAAAPTDAALAVAVHHPPYSADAHHGGSAYMAGVLDAAFAAAGRTPDLVLAGHVHDYQRFTRPMGKAQLAYVVAGAGGYWHLHNMGTDANGGPLPKPWKVPGQDLTLETYVDDRHGYLRLTATANSLHGEYVTVPRAQESWSNGPVAVADAFTVDLGSHTVSTGGAPLSSASPRRRVAKATGSRLPAPKSRPAKKRS